MTYTTCKRKPSLALSLALVLALAAALIGAGTATAARPYGVAFFTAPFNRDVSAGQTQKIWVHTMAAAGVTLTVDYGNGQSATQLGTTDSGGIHVFQWTVDYTGTAVVWAHYRVDAARGTLFTSGSGTFLLFPPPALYVGVAVFTPSLHVGDALRVHVYTRPGITLTLSVRSEDGAELVARTAQADAGGNWWVSVPVSATISHPHRLHVVVTGANYGRPTTVVSFVTLQPRLAPVPAVTPSTIPVAPSTSLDHERRVARANAQGSFSLAQSNARSAVSQLAVDMQVLAQWSAVTAPHSSAYYNGLLARASSYDDFIEVTAQATSADALVQARMRAVMPHKAIMVSLAEQALRAYQDGRLVLFSYVTTGRPALPTVTGHFYIYEKVTPFEFHSPWPPGSPYYYPPTWIKYWMPFYSGYGLHDAWWRAHYGPGTNVYGDGPGSSEPTGTHGCINIPFNNTLFLWNWAPVGTPVVVYGGPSVAAGPAGI